MTPQEAFDAVCAHAATMKWMSIDMARGSDGCAYRGTGGSKCFIGALIPDDEYQAVFEGRTADTIRYKVSTLKKLKGGWMKELQRIHDDLDVWAATGFIGWPKLRDFAASHGLDASAVDHAKQAQREAVWS